MAGTEKPRLLLYAMYDPRGLDRGPTVRISLLGAALAAHARVRMIAGGPVARVPAASGWLRKAGWSSVDAVYVESPTSWTTPFDLAFLAGARRAGRPVGVYFRDAYQRFRSLYPRTRPRQLLTDVLWRASTPLLARVASRRFSPSAGLAEVLDLADPVLLPPGTDPRLPDLGVGREPLVAYVGGLTEADGFPLLLAAMERLRVDAPAARLRAISTASLPSAPPWLEVLRAGRDSLGPLLAPARACTIPRPVNAYTDLAVPVKLMDYLSFGKPVVATAAAETARLIEMSGAGLVAGPTADALAAGLSRVLLEDGLAERLGRRARDAATHPDWTWDARARTILEALLGPGSMPRGDRSREDRTLYSARR